MTGRLKDALINDTDYDGNPFGEPVESEACAFVKDTNFSKVGEFHETFGHPYYDFMKPPVKELSAKLTRLRINLIWEEFVEFIQATTTPEVFEAKFKLATENFKAIVDSIQENEVKLNVVEAADALGDIEYVVNGAAHVLNIDLDDVVEEIHRSNMSKADPVTGKPIVREDGKVLKGPAYFKPNIAKVLKLEVNEEVPF